MSGASDIDLGLSETLVSAFRPQGTPDEAGRGRPADLYLDNISNACAEQAIQLRPFASRVRCNYQRLQKVFHPLFRRLRLLVDSSYAQTSGCGPAGTHRATPIQAHIDTAEFHR